MSKSSKSARHADDKNYQKKVMNAPQKLIFEGNMKQLHDPRNYPNAGTTRPSNVGAGKKFKSKLRSPTKPKTLHAPPGTAQSNQSQTMSTKIVDKRLSLAPLSNPKQYGTMKVHQDGGESMMLHQTKASRKEMKQIKTAKVDDSTEKEKETIIEPVDVSAPTTNTNGKSSEIELIQDETAHSPLVDSEIATTECVSIEISTQDTNETNSKSDENTSNGHKEDKPTEEKLDEITEKSESIEIIVTTQKEKINEEHEENEKEEKEKKENELTVTIEVKEEIVKIKNDENASESNLVGSTTSESSPLKNLENQMNKQDDNSQAKETDDVSFISYHSNIMLKDVQIKLNDCLKDNSKLLDITDPNASMSEGLKDLSFGRTLRGISGRNSLKRMKHVTVRERLLTPNDSLFVNTSGTPLLQDQSRYSDPLYHNSNRYDKKRKLNDDANELLKKPKIDANYGLLNTSLEYLKNLRNPVQVSTPKAHGYKFHIDEKKTNDGDHSIAIEQTEEPKKWCILM